MGLQLAKKMGRLGTETAFEVLARANELERQGKKVIHFEIGESAFDTPEHIKISAIKALEQGKTHYSPSQGVPEFIEVICQWFKRTRKIDVSPREVVVTPGGKPIMFYSMISLLEEGDEVIYPDPGFPIYASVVNFLGATPKPLFLREKDEFRYNIEELEKLISPRTKLLIINSPQNPTGSMLLKEDLNNIAELAKKYDFYVLSDEVYSTMLYEGEFESIIQFEGMKERTIILESLSKHFAMTGWRVGFGVMPEKLAPHLTRLITNSVSCTPTFLQYAGIDALNGSFEPVGKMVSTFKQNRDVMVDGLNAIEGITCLRPKGAFYVFPNVKSFGIPSSELEKYFLENYYVAVLSGTAFGQNGEGYLRLSYPTSLENIKEGLSRLKEGFDNLRKRS